VLPKYTVPPTTSGDEKIAPFANCRAVATIGASRHAEGKKNRALNLRSAVSIQSALRLDVSVWNSHSRAPESKSRASSEPFRMPVNTTLPATAGDANV